MKDCPMMSNNFVINLLICLTFFIGPIKETCAQVRAIEAGSAEGLLQLQNQLQNQRTKRAVINPVYGMFSIAALEVGHWGIPAHLDAKVIQVIDENKMLVKIEDDRIIDEGYGHLVIIKCPTKNIVDGKFWRSEKWKQMVGANALKVTGTERYATVGGSTNTVFVLETMSDAELSKLMKYRVWSTREGTLLAKFVKLEKNQVVLEKQGTAELVTVNAYKLSRSDRLWLRNEVKRRTEDEKTKQTNMKETAASTKSKSDDESDSTLPSSWLNTTYNVTVRRVGDSNWQEIDQKTGRNLNHYKTVSNNNEYTELYDEKRKYEVRLYADKMMLKKDGKWIRVAQGHWSESVK